jgi:hypothetical protein
MKMQKLKTLHLKDKALIQSASLGIIMNMKQQADI